MGIMDDLNLVSSKVSLTLDLPPSCIQFCPAHPEFFVVGTYNLQKGDTQETQGEDDESVAAAKTPQSRNGSLLVFKLNGTEL